MTGSWQDDRDRFYELSLDLLAVAGLDGFFRRVSPSWTRVLGWSQEELFARPVLDFVHPDDRAATATAREPLRAGEPLLGLVNRYQCRDGTYRWLEWRSAASPEHGLVYAAARDITERKLAEEQHADATRQLIFTDRMASVGTLAAGMAHEINNPLAYLTANLSLLVDGVGALLEEAPTPVLRELLEMANDAAQGADRVKQLVRSLTSLSRAGAERRSVADLRSVLEVALKIALSHLRHRAGLVLDYRWAPLVEVDEARLGQVFINLLVNAAQALPEGRDENEVRVTVGADPSGAAFVEVQDNGPGVPEALCSRIFDPFFTTKPVGVGTGLGLFICHEIVSGLGGTITVRNQPGSGALFRVTIPAAEGQPGAAHCTPPVGRPAVLVIDHDTSGCVGLAAMLRAHDVCIFSRAREASRRLADGPPPRVIFLDLVTPEISGIQLYETLVVQDPQAAARVVFLTEGSVSPAVPGFLARTKGERLHKPFVAAAVRAVVERVGAAGQPR